MNDLQSRATQAMVENRVKGIPQSPVKVAPHTFVCGSWTRVGKAYEQDTAGMTCTCFAWADPKSRGYHQPCKHLKAAVTLELIECLEKAEAVDTATLAKLLPRYRHNKPQAVAIIATVVLRKMEQEETELAMDRAEGLEDQGSGLQLDQDALKAMFA